MNQRSFQVRLAHIGHQIRPDDSLKVVYCEQSEEALFITRKRCKIFAAKQKRNCTDFGLVLRLASPQARKKGVVNTLLLFFRNEPHARGGVHEQRGLGAKVRRHQGRRVADELHQVIHRLVRPRTKSR
jgi:hypothetical protein